MAAEWYQVVGALVPQKLRDELEKQKFLSPQILEVQGDLDAAGLRALLTEVLCRACTLNELTSFQMLVEQSAKYAATKRRKTILYLNNNELRPVEEKKPVFSERERLEAGASKKLMRPPTSYPIASKKKQETKEELRKRLAIRIGVILRLLDFPAAKMMEGSLAPELLLGRFAAGRRSGTLRGKLSMYDQVSKYMSIVHGKAFPTKPVELLDYLMERAEEPCGVSIPGTIMGMISFFEEVGGVAVAVRLSTNSMVKAVFSDVMLQLIGTNPKQKRKARRLFACMLSSWEFKVCDARGTDWTRVHAWCKLVKVWAAHRTGDQAGIPAMSLSFVDGVLKGRIEATKTTGPGKRIAVLPFAVTSDAWLMRPDWLEVGWRLYERYVTPRPYLLPLPADDTGAFSTNEPTYSQSVAATRVLISETVTYKWVTGEDWDYVQLTDGDLMFAMGAQAFFTGHTDRCCIPTWAAAIGESKEDVDRAGRWAPEDSEGYVRITQEVVMRLQGNIARAYRNRGQKDVFYEKALLEELREYCQQRDMAPAALDEMLEKIRKCSEVTGNADDHDALQAEAVSDDDNGNGNLEVSDCEDVPPTFEAGLWIVSEPAMTLHKTGSCFRKPGVHYSRYRFLNESDLDDARIDKCLYKHVCLDCFPKGLGAAASDSSSTDSDESEDEP